VVAGLGDSAGPYPDTARRFAGRTVLSRDGLLAQKRDSTHDASNRSTAVFPLVSSRAHKLFVAAVILADLAAVFSAVALSALVRYPIDELARAAVKPVGIALLALVPLVWIALLSARETYAPRVLVTALTQAIRVIGAAIPAWVLMHLLAFLIKARVPLESRLVAGISFPVCIAFLIAVRLALILPFARRMYPRLARGSILVLGDTTRAERLAEDLQRAVGSHRNVFLRSLGTTGASEAASLVGDEGCSEVVIEPDGRDLDELFEVVFACLDEYAEVMVVSDQFRVVMGRASIADVEGVPAMRFRRLDLAGPEGAVKRLIDLVGSAAGIVVLSPVLAAIAIAVKISSPGPIFYRQERVGRGGRRFTMYKFRTMVTGNDSKVHQDYLRAYIQDGAAASTAQDGTKIYKLTEDPRITGIGSWLRALSLDELPQLWNVLRGDMSLVGPRPCLPYEWDLYEPWQRRRLDVLPGCTGLWQVTARSHVTFEEMVILDLHYAHQGTIGRDLRLIAQTIPAMIRGRGGF